MTSTPPPPITTGERFARAVAIMARLRAPGGCPWDREQTFDSIKPYTVEETYEVLEAIDNRDWPELAGELGDLLLQVLFYAQIASEEGRFSIDDVLDRLSTKLVDRHPHVFGEAQAATSSEVIKNWEALKAEERKKKADASIGEKLPQSSLAGASSSMPAFIEAHKLSSRAARVGFDWPDLAGVLDKLKEETRELEELTGQLPADFTTRANRVANEGAAGSGRNEPPKELRERIEEEIGDLFFSLVNVARYLALDSESALKKANRKFRRRFEKMESELIAHGKTVASASADELERLWQKAKLDNDIQQL